jgi:serine/threonine protein phosphatase 1
MNNKVEYYDWNLNGRQFVIGDIHGCYDDFLLLLKHVGFDKLKDKMYSVGDLVDRGPDSLNCLELVFEPWFKAVLANHEDMMFRATLKDDQNMLDSWLYNGGMWVYQHDIRAIRQICEEAEKKMPYVIVIGKDSEKRINIVHAEMYRNSSGEGFASDEDIDNWNFGEYQETNMIWGRSIAENRILFRSGKYRDIKTGLSTTYVGHTPCDKHWEVLNHRFIDTGAVYYHTKQLDRVMTMVDLATEVVYELNMRTGEVKESIFGLESV